MTKHRSSTERRRHARWGVRVATSLVLGALVTAASPSRALEYRPALAITTTTVPASPGRTTIATTQHDGTGVGVTRSTAKPNKPTKPTIAPKPPTATYRGPTVVNGLPFPTALPSGTPLQLAESFARDATDLLNCEYGHFDRCAKAVWGRRDPWKMTQEGSGAAFDAPWVALWAKYNAVGVEIWQRNGPYTGAYPQGVPTLDLYYRLTIDGQVFGLWLREEPASVRSDPRSWHVPGCAVCFAYQVHPRSGA